MNHDWTPCFNFAACSRRPVWEGLCDDPAHECGLHAATGDRVPYSVGNLIGVVEGFGDITESETGFRAEKMKIIGFVEQYEDADARTSAALAAMKREDIVEKVDSFYKDIKPGLLWVAGLWTITALSAFTAFRNGFFDDQFISSVSEYLLTGAAAGSGTTALVMTLAGFLGWAHTAVLKQKLKHPTPVPEAVLWDSSVVETISRLYPDAVWFKDVTEASRTIQEQTAEHYAA